jgi:hypothetical protein
MLSYPVQWNKDRILRDIVRNFYDDVGMRQFYKAFKSKYDPTEKAVSLTVTGKGFSYEWLLHMGASTKQGQLGKFAGFFDELLEGVVLGFCFPENPLLGKCIFENELCHCFGGDASATFSLALTDVMSYMVKNSETLQRYNSLWLEQFDSH